VSWITPAAKGAIKLGVTYAPHAKTAWDTAGKPVQNAVQTQARYLAAQRKAFKEAAELVDGTVLRLTPGGQPVWVVWSGDEPHSAYPTPSTDLATLVAHADLSRRQTPEQHREAQLRARASRAGKKAGKVGLRTATQVGRKAGQVGTTLARVPQRRS
jgi:hypothetical protein